MKRPLLRLLSALLILYVVVCLFLYFFQEKIIFHPHKLDKNYIFHFDRPFREITTQGADGKKISNVLFKTDSSRGLVFYLHGNAGSAAHWEYTAGVFNNLHYDVWMHDYRGYGKSEGEIKSENQLHEDAKNAYKNALQLYPENKIIVIGYSIGTGIAARLASEHHPRQLVLQAPYYNLTDLMKNRFPVIPTFILKYKLKTNQYLSQCKMPVILIHGDADEVIYYGSSLKLKSLFKPADTLITLKGQTHTGFPSNEDYLNAIRKILSR